MALTFTGLNLSSSQIEQMRDAARDADIAAARAFGFGPAYWYVDRPTGAGTTGPRTLTRVLDDDDQPLQVNALAYRQQPSVLAGNTSGQPVGNEIWRAIVLDLAADIHTGDTLVSVPSGDWPEGNWQLLIDHIEPWYNHRRAEVSEVRHG